MKDNGANQQIPARSNSCCVEFNVAQQDESGLEADGCFYKHPRSPGHQQRRPSSRWLPSLLGQLAIKCGGTSVLGFFPLMCACEEVTKYANMHSWSFWECPIVRHFEGSETKDDISVTASSTNIPKHRGTNQTRAQ